MPCKRRSSLGRRICQWAAAVLSATIVVIFAHNAHAQGCGGVERWLVKVAADDLAASVDPSDVSETTVVDLNNERRPRGANGAGDTRLPEEMSLVAVKGFIRFIKLERDDNDFHLVITDSADAEFTPAGTGSRPTGTSLIAEARIQIVLPAVMAMARARACSRATWRMSERALPAIWTGLWDRMYLSR